MINKEPAVGKILYYDCGYDWNDEWVKIKVLKITKRTKDEVVFMAEILENHNCWCCTNMEVGNHREFSSWFVYKSLKDLYKNWEKGENEE